MAKVYQFRYFPQDSNTEKQQPSDISDSGLISGEIFNKYLPILQLGIQTLPGTKFYLNNNVEPIFVGSTGIFELDLTGGVEIVSMTIDKSSLEKIKELKGYLIIDIIYEGA